MYSSPLSKYPLVTVHTLIYNTDPNFVIEAIKSVRNNRYPNIQHIIIDDYSSNPIPKQIVKKWIEEENYECEFYEHEKNYGICNSLNHVLEIARGKYLLGCSDDILFENFILSSVEKLERNNLDVLYSQVLYTTPNESYVFPAEIHIDEFLNCSDKADFLLVKNILPAISAVYKTEILKSVGGYDNNLKYEDLDMNIRLMRKNVKFSFEKEVYSQYFKRSTGYSLSEGFLIARFEVLKKYNNLRSYELAYRSHLKLCFNDGIDILRSDNIFVLQSHPLFFIRVLTHLIAKNILRIKIIQRVFLEIIKKENRYSLKKIAKP